MPDTQVTQQNTKAQDILKNISKGDLDINKLIKFVKDGHKLDNFAMRQLIEKLRNENGFDDSKLLTLYLELDKMVEDGLVNNDFINKLDLK